MSLCSPWIEEDARLADCGCPEATELVINSAIQIASEILYRLSGRQWPGLCSETVRPCFVNTACGCSRLQPCGCIGADMLKLPRDRVTEVTQILIDGAAFTDYTLYAPNLLARTDDQLWPCCQDLGEATTELDTWSVTYSYGAEPPEGGKHAARLLTTEITKQCTGGTCSLPAGATTVNRRGVTYNREAFDGHTGLPIVDLWLSSVNPKKRARKAKIIGPDDPRFIPATVTGS